MPTLLCRWLGVRVFARAAVVVGFATAASATTLTVSTTDLANNPKNLFTVGEAFLLKVTGDAQRTGPSGQDLFAAVQVFWDAALTTTVALPVGCTGSSLLPCSSAAQGDWFVDKGDMFLSDGSAYVMNQAGARTATIVDTSFITLTADAIGTTSVVWGGTLLAFFEIYAYGDSIHIPTGHSFTIVPEPGALGLLAAGLLGLVGWRRARA